MKTITRSMGAKPPATMAELVAAHPPRPIGDDVDLRNTEEIVERLAVLPHRTRDQDDYLEVLSTLIEYYEAEHFAIDFELATPITRLKYLMRQSDMNASDLGRLLGDRTVGRKILAGRRELSKSHIVKLAHRFRVNPGIFIAV